MSHALPVTFSPAVKSDNSVIHEDSYLNVDFVAPTCRMLGVSTMWKVKFKAIVRGFAITKHGGDKGLYQLSYWPNSKSLGKSSCNPLGNVVNRLARSSVPFHVDRNISQI
ncbi:hypothetical protein SADUNF_Sadunf19G0113400 [Salix dunnii]|uniref:Uncharacterized protein n=1 Tax=Salix dunnii TaxID=1413687 RepID=A0A835MLJ6_9ROSI|nr:hypothetical protein SADUNF_Sadunf19G0113400 [Salix dunnii]